MMRRLVSRRALFRAGFAGAATLTLAGCDGLDELSNQDNTFRKAMAAVNGLTYRAQRLLVGGTALAPEYSESDIRQAQRPNGSVDPDGDLYVALRQNGFAGYRLRVAGLVERTLSLSLPDLRSMPQRTQITRHDCVEGWSTIAKWQGVPLHLVLERCGLKPSARFVVFRCFDALSQGLGGPEFYYESIDLLDAHHPQTILAHSMNGTPLPIENGAPLRVRVERQLGYKMAKYIRNIEIVSDLNTLYGGNGGYWEDRGYDWYAGI